MSWARSRTVTRALSVALGAVFVYASWDKILDPAGFARIVYHYRLLGPGPSLPPLLPNLLSVTLPWIELLTGGLLLLGAWRREAAATAAGLLIVFVGAVAFALAQGIDIENCGCFSLGSEGRRAGLGLIAGDLALLGVAALLATGSGSTGSGSPIERGRPGAAVEEGAFTKAQVPTDASAEPEP